MNATSAPRVHLLLLAIAWTALAFVAREVQAHDKPAGAPPDLPPSVQWSHQRMAIPDLPVIDQDGVTRRFYADLVKGRTVAINFIFTTCSSVCPPLTAVFRSTQQALQQRLGQDISLISISVDPLNDSPRALKQFASKFDAGPGWNFVTGNKADIDRLLDALGASTALRDNHTPLVLVGNDRHSKWTRLHGLAPPALLQSTLLEAAGAPATPQARTLEAGAMVKTVATEGGSTQQRKAAYFTNLPLQTQNNRTVRFYDDLISGHIVLINAMFVGCTSVCSPATKNLQRVQAALGPELAARVRFISITVDPLSDTPQVLKEYAAAQGVPDAWFFLTGKRENVDWVLYKLGAFAEDPQSHSTVLLIGNDLTGEWVKMMSMSPPLEIANTVQRLARSGSGS
jgi:cytochrome oxidase Cu insertion factor (SCO1/SenC/PrrC family)